MPIKPENVHRYPPDWEDIRSQVLMRAGHRCEWPGCGVPNHSVGYWERERFVIVNVDLLEPRAYGAIAEHGHRLIRVVLTVAHLDHTPENCDLSNLRAWCQRHHLRYDLEHHRTTAYMTRHALAGDVELF